MHIFNLDKNILKAKCLPLVSKYFLALLPPIFHQKIFSKYEIWPIFVILPRFPGYFKGERGNILRFLLLGVY